MKILIAMPVEEQHRIILENAAPNAEYIYKPAAEVDEQTVKEADIIVGNVPPKFIVGSRNLKLMQLNSAGTDGYTMPGVLPIQATLTNATGAYGVAIAEHMIGSLLCLMKKLDRYRMNMEENVWKDQGPVTSVYGSKTLVVGFGDIGSEFAIRMNAMGSEVSAIRRNQTDKPEYIKALYQMDRFYQCLEDADIVATALPGTPETYHIFNEEAFSHMKKGSYLINVGRGTAVDSDALVDAINKKIVIGAALDVTDPEPLPSTHALWNTPGVLITPHVSGGYHLMETHNRIIQIAARNIKHCINDEPYENEVDMTTGYRKLM